jgi:hypothetical protein
MRFICLFFFLLRITLGLARRKTGSFIRTLDDLQSDISAQSSNNDEDQIASNAMIAIKYKDKSGKLQTITTDATGFTFRTLKPEETSELKKKQGLK